jgi:hypothetical protein
LLPAAAAVAVIVAESTERVSAAVEVAAKAGSYHDVAVAPRPRALSDKAWEGGSVEGAVVVVEVLNDLVVEFHLLSQQQVVGHSLGAMGVLLEVQLVRWGKQVQQPGEHQRVEAYPPEDGR